MENTTPQVVEKKESLFSYIFVKNKNFWIRSFSMVFIGFLLIGLIGFLFRVYHLGFDLVYLLLLPVGSILLITPFIMLMKLISLITKYYFPKSM